VFTAWKCKEPGKSVHSLADLCFDDLILTKKKSNQKHNLSKSKTVNLLAREEQKITIMYSISTSTNSEPLWCNKLPFRMA
jgi:hypothetical protein